MSQHKITKLMRYDESKPEGAGSALEEKLFLFSLVRMLKPDSIIEIGVSAGHMTAWLALALVLNEKGRLISVDNWSRAHGGQAASSQKAFRRISEVGLHLERVVKFVDSDSVEYLKSCPDNSVDMVWIDGDHSFEGARADIDEGSRVAKKVIAVHDTNQIYDGVRNAIKDIYTESLGFWVKGCRGIWLKDLA